MKPLRHLKSLTDCGSGGSLASWGHLGGGYDAKYYSYVWSRVIATDLYSKFQESGDPLNSELGLKYRRTILEPGGTVDGDVMVKEYLGRDIRIEPFLEACGVNKQSKQSKKQV